MNQAKFSTGRAHYGWVMVFATFILTALCFGGLGLVAVFIKPLAQEFGWQRGDISVAYMIATAGTALASIVFGRISDRGGIKVIAIWGAICMGVTLVLLARATTVWQIYILYACFGALGHAAVYVPLTASVSNWFSENRGLAVGIASAGSALGLGIVPLIASAIIADSGWRDAWLYLGIGYLVVALPTSLLVSNPPNANISAPSGLPQRPVTEEPAPISPREAHAWVCTAAIFCCICMSVPMVHVPALVSDLGLDAERSASVLTVIMVAGAAGRLVFGRVADRAGPLSAYILASFGQTAFVFWFVQAPTLASLYAIAIGFGLSFGGVMTSLLLTIRSLVPARMAATAMALAALFGWIGMGVGGYFGGLLFDWEGTYLAAFVAAALAGGVNLIILTSLFVRLRRAAHLSFEMTSA